LRLRFLFRDFIDNHDPIFKRDSVKTKTGTGSLQQYYVGWNFNSGNYLFTTDTK